MRDPDIDYKEKGKHESELVIQYDVLYWRIGIELNAPITVGSAVLWHEYFLVDQEGAVTSALQISSTPIDIIVCEGTGTCANLVLTDLVIDAVGTCQSGYDCSGTTNKYQVPWDTAHEVEDMWENLLNDVGCCNVGKVNVLNGEVTEINVGGSTGGAPGTYTTGDILGLPNTRYGYITLDDTISGYAPIVTAHEMGHAFHALKSFSTRGVSDTVPGTNAEKRDYHAVSEALAEINSVIYENYQGNETFDNPPDWTTYGGHDYSVEFDYGDLSYNNTDYKNARVAGHAFYEFAEAIGDFATAAKVFVKSFNYLEDGDENYRLSFAEMRQAQVDAAAALGMSTNVKNALKNAWESVGVGSGAKPNTPTSVSLSNKGCSGGYGYFVYFNEVPNADEYEVWENDGSGWDEVDDTTSSPADVTSTTDATVRIRACNNLGCSAYSASDWYIFNCTM